MSAFSTKAVSSGLHHAARWIVLFILSPLLAACDNSPQPSGSGATNTLFTAFSERSPRYLDPTASYSNNETAFTFSIYEPLYGYHYLKRPYELVPKAATKVVTPVYLDKQGRTLPEDAPGEQIAESVYDIPIRTDIRYAPHPAFAKDAQGHHLYHHLEPGDVGDKRSPWDFEQKGTRALVADDFVYAIKRHATTRIAAPVFGVFSEYVVGLKDYAKVIREEDAKLRQGLDPAALDKPFLDFRKFPLAGATALDEHTLRIRIVGKYPQWKYWMALTFLAPIPWEVDAFYAQPGMARNGLSLNSWPVGTGAFMMTESVQDRRHVLTRNPNYHDDPYPCEGAPGDKEAGLLADCGKPMPFVDQVVFSMEKESVPLAAKFRQGYYDVPEIERPEWGITFDVEKQDSADVAREFDSKSIKLPRSVDISNWYLGFNWLDPVVGHGDTPAAQVRNRKLRQALSIAIDWEEYGRVFPKKGGEVAMGPLPGGLFGSRHGTLAGVNPVTHVVVDGKPVRRPIEDARRLMAEAGYADGRDSRSGKPLVLNYDYQRAPTPEIKAELDWMVKQFAKLGVQLEIRATDYNQFQDKMRQGKVQVFWWGWLADYPDAENFLFLLYGPNAKSTFDGENAANYANPEFDRRYASLRFMEDGPAKQKVIDEMTSLVQQDAVWAFGFFPFASGAYQPWVGNGKPGLMVRDMTRYYKIDAPMRARLQAEWNKPVVWPMVAGSALLLLLVWGGRVALKRREGLNARGERAVRRPPARRPASSALDESQAMADEAGSAR